ncbi:MAG: zinc ABC transporter substrate-binding protein [Syntrophomonadaceae bacterium]|nr:zinc ABC transporter substrate-binding protein [Syntrophomonadaceae bacterium]
MKRNSYLITMLLLLGLMMLTTSGCNSTREVNSNADQIKVAVTILPQAELVNKIGGEQVAVSVLVPPGVDPHTYELSPGQLKELSETALYIRIGHIDFEKNWMNRIAGTNKDMVIIDSSQSIEIINGDPHIWLSPRLAKIQAENIARALQEADPEHQQYYADRLQNLQKELDQLDSDIGEKLSPLKGSKFLVFHPSWGYFARDYGLEEIAIERDGKEPTAKELAELLSWAKTEGIKVIFASPQHSTREAEAVARELGGEVVIIDPLAGDYFPNLKKVADTMATALK